MNIPSEEFGTFRIRDDDALERRLRSIRAVHNILRGMGKYLELSVDVYKPKRSTDQNSLLWVRHGWTADRLNELQGEMVANLSEGDWEVDAITLAALRNPWTKDAVHNLIFKPRFCRGQSSTRMTKMEMVDAMNEYEVWQAEIGVQFPEQEYA